MRLVPMEGDRLHLSAEEAVKLCDENTIAVVPVLGSTFDGSYEPVKEICDALDDLQARTGPRRPGPRRRRLRRRSSPRSSTPISSGTSACRGSRRSTSPGTSTGSSTPASAGSSGGTPRRSPTTSIFWVNYLGDNMPTFALNFSRPGRPGRRPVLQLPPPRLRGVPAGAGVRARGGHAALRADRRAGAVRAADEGRRAAGLRLQAEGRDRQLHRLRRLQRPARARLAGAGVHVPEEPRGPRGAAGRGQARLQPGPGRPADPRPQAPAATAQKQPAPVHDRDTATASTITAGRRVLETTWRSWSSRWWPG